MSSQIRLFGARQNNLKNLDVAFDTGKITVLTGVSGSGKSSLAFDTLYAEGQRRYVETFSPYARQFLDRMDKPQIDAIEGILPAIAIDQVNPVRNSRSSVGTMTELNNYFKVLYARLAQLHCRQCGQIVHHEDAQHIATALTARCADSDPRLVIGFSVEVPENFSQEEIQHYLAQQGYTRLHTPQQPSDKLYVIQDRFRLSRAEPERLMEALDAALHYGHGHLTVFAIDEEKNETPWHFSAGLHCAHCDITYSTPQPSTFSFNSPLGACKSCRGFGRVMGIDYGLVVPDENKSILEGAIRPWQTAANKKHQDALEEQAKKADIRITAPWKVLSQTEKDWVIERVQRFFDRQEKRAYRMHVRVMLAKYRSYSTCPTCHGSRLKDEALLWRLEGRSIHDLMLLPITELRDFFVRLRFQGELNAATQLLRDEVNSRLGFLCEVGLGYLSLDRQSRTLSGGEVQRINLTTALGTSLVNTLFVLDEPSIGLHPHDMHRIVAIMQRLRNNGNTLVVVEHDPLVMGAADRILDIGPGPGERGGQILFDGAPQQLRDANTLTGDYLSGRKHIDAPLAQPITPDTAYLQLLGVSAHNLQHIDAHFPLQRLVCVTGVSGSGKSTLIQDVLYPALLKHFGQPTEAPGAFNSLEGAQQLAEAILVDQSPIGRTARSNPASYVGAFDAIRKLFAKAPLAVERGYKPSTFSFNSGDGRCAGCGGTGFEHIEMQFLSDVYLRCGECGGKRFKASTLEVVLTHQGNSASIDEVLAMTVNEALAFFTGLHEVQRALAPLADVGLDYLTLGQPVPTLSGGEAQRLKLAGYLAEASKSRLSTAKVAKKGKLFLFDEPTTGLHFDDIAKLMQAFRKLLAAGHSLIVIEHNLDVIRAADWVIDLGPKGGTEGGHIVAVGTPAELMQQPASLTGQALVGYEQDQLSTRVLNSTALPLAAEPSTHYAEDKAIRLLNARENNLKNVNLSIPRDTFTVITGVSGSGKSTLAFDILFNEGQRRYLESLNAYARSIVQPAGQPDVDAIYGIPPTVAIEQRTSRGGYKSTVATTTEIYHFLRLLYCKLASNEADEVDTANNEPDPQLFSYNSPFGWCESCSGTGTIMDDLDEPQRLTPPACKQCNGQRLNPTALAFKWQGKNIAELCTFSIDEAVAFFSTLKLNERELDIGRDLFSELQHRLQFMQEVGLGYLGLDRAAPTLSGGEAQRIRLASQLGSNLQGVCYVLDEPTIGLHPRDNQILLQALQRLEANGNTLVVVEHDEDTIRQAQHVIDIGPGAGVRGGEVVAEGTVEAIMANPASLTGQYLKQPMQHPLQPYRPVDETVPYLSVKKASLHNLQQVNAQLPLERLCVITGVSGSGKSTFAREVLLANLKQKLAEPENYTWQHCETIDGWDAVDRVLEVDQTPIGKTPRSCPATYVGFWDDIRKLFAQTRDAKLRGWTATRFSFNTGDGRCGECGGQGMVNFEMSFLPDIKVLCESCQGQRFNNDTLSVRWQGKNIGDVLRMEVDEAVEYFSSHPRILRPLTLMQDVGLGYLTLGQASPTLSGGEAQRIKLVAELSKVRLDEGVIRTGRASKQPHTLYVLDEPTVGLAMADVEKLLRVLHRLVDAGQSVVVIEHNLDLIAEADWIVDMGPEGGEHGGRLVVEGTANQVTNTAVSHTGQALAAFLSRGK